MFWAALLRFGVAIMTPEQSDQQPRPFNYEQGKEGMREKESIPALSHRGTAGFHGSAMTALDI